MGGNAGTAPQHAPIIAVGSTEHLPSACSLRRMAYPTFAMTCVSSQVRVVEKVFAIMATCCLPHCTQSYTVLLVLSLSLHADGSQVVAAVGSRVLVYDTTDGDLLHALKGHKVGGCMFFIICACFE